MEEQGGTRQQRSLITRQQVTLTSTTRKKQVTVGNKNKTVRTNGHKLTVNSLWGSFLVTVMLQCEHIRILCCLVAGNITQGNHKVNFTLRYTGYYH